MQQSLTAGFHKGGQAVQRSLARPRDYVGADGVPFTLCARSVLLVRNVGLHMDTNVILDANRKEVPENIVDALITSLIALHDLHRPRKERNSKAGSVYIVRPKMHGPDEVSYCNDLFVRIEEMLGLAKASIKIGIMDEERRTSANLAACLFAARTRVSFINTGFLDRTGDEIHTSMRAGAILPKADIRNSVWLSAYEDRNVVIGLAAGFAGRAQIGKGMWPSPNRMADMLTQKVAHPMSGANTAWVPSPTAATLHALHYHQIDVIARQHALAASHPSSLTELLQPPLANSDWDENSVRFEVENNAQSILGYVVRWIDQGIGCSTVPDIHGVGLMEDRATLRISSQHIANWLQQGVLSESEIVTAFRRMAVIVDNQNKDDPRYQPMSPSYDGVAFRTALRLALEGASQPNGYTEWILHPARRAIKRV
jgi:malate synthase